MAKSKCNLAEVKGSERSSLTWYLVVQASHGNIQITRYQPMPRPPGSIPLGAVGGYPSARLTLMAQQKKNRTEQNRAEKKPAQNNCFPLSNNFLYLGFPTAFAPNKACQWAWPCSVLYLAQQIELSVKKKKRIRKIQKCKECWPSPAKTG